MVANGQTPGPLICKHCGTPIKGTAYLEKETGIYIGEECFFRETYLDGIVAQIEATYLATIEALVSAVDAREHETGNHSLRVSRLAIILGYRSGLRDRELVDLYCGALPFESALAEIGKESGTVFDPALVQTLAVAQEELRAFIGRIPSLPSPEGGDP